MQLKIKKLHPNAVIPTYAHADDAGLDLTAVSRRFDEHGNIVYGLGIAVEIPSGYYGQIQPRSSVTKHDLVLCNTPAIIDANFRGEITVKFRPAPKFDQNEGIDFGTKFFNVGDRVAQLIIQPYPKIEFIEVDELSETDRGTGAYGSTGK